MQVRFADLAERTRDWDRSRAARANERRHVHALCDAIQTAIAEGRHDRVHVLLKEMRGVVSAALVRRGHVRS